MTKVNDITFTYQEQSVFQVDYTDITSPCCRLTSGGIVSSHFTEELSHCWDLDQLTGIWTWLCLVTLSEPFPLHFIVKAPLPTLAESLPVWDTLWTEGENLVPIIKVPCEHWSGTLGIKQRALVPFVRLALSLHFIHSWASLWSPKWKFQKAPS